MAPRPVSNPRKSARNYAKSPSSRAKKAAYQAEFNKRPDQVAKRIQLRRERRRRGIDGTGGPDMSHTKRGGLVAENASRNRARNRGKK